MVWLLVAAALAAIFAYATLSDYSGPLAARLRYRCLYASSFSLFAAAAVLALREPWVRPEGWVGPSKVHSAGAVFSLLMNAVLQLGPQMTALILAGIGYWLFDGARCGRQLYQRGISDLPPPSEKRR